MVDSANEILTEKDLRIYKLKVKDPSVQESINEIIPRWQNFTKAEPNSGLLLYTIYCAVGRLNECHPSRSLSPESQVYQEQFERDAAEFNKMDTIARLLRITELEDKLESEKHFTYLSLSHLEKGLKTPAETVHEDLRDRWNVQSKSWNSFHCVWSAFNQSSGNKEERNRALLQYFVESTKERMMTSGQLDEKEYLMENGTSEMFDECRWKLADSCMPVANLEVEQTQDIVSKWADELKFAIVQQIDKKLWNKTYKCWATLTWRRPRVTRMTFLGVLGLLRIHKLTAPCNIY